MKTLLIFTVVLLLNLVVFAWSSCPKPGMATKFKSRDGFDRNCGSAHDPRLAKPLPSWLAASTPKARGQFLFFGKGYSRAQQLTADAASVLCRLTVVIPEKSPEPFLAAEFSGCLADTALRLDQSVAHCLMIPLFMIMANEFVDGAPQRIFPEED